MIAILCNAGPDVQGAPRKSILFIDEHDGSIQDARIGWPAHDEKGFIWGPIMRVTPDEYEFQVKLALGSGA